jgi:hypothetical protein
MAFSVKVESPTDRPKQHSTRTADESWRELIPLVQEAIQLYDNALPIVVPEDEAPGVVTALRKAGIEQNVTIRFQTFPVIDPETGAQKVNDQKKGVVSYFQSARKGHVRITFWTSKKIYRPKARKDSQTAEESTAEEPTSKE